MHDDANIIIKSSEQIDGIRRSCRLASACLDFIQPHVQPGITTGQLDEMIESYIRDHGAIPAPKGYEVDGRIYPKATCISLNEVVCHGIPGEEVIQEGDILNIDVTTILDGYFGDTSKMFYGGGTESIAKDALELCQRTRDALFIGISQVKPGAHLGNVGAAIADAMHEYGYTGIRFHEPPNVPHVAQKGTGPTLKPGMVFTIEPMVNIGTAEVVINEVDGWTVRTADNNLSAQWEHTILVTDQPPTKEPGHQWAGCEVLTFPTQSS